MSAFAGTRFSEKETIEDAAIAVYQIGALLDLVMTEIDGMPGGMAYLSNVVGAAAGYARLVSQRLDALPITKN